MTRLTAQALRPFIAAAVRGSENLSPIERADVYEGIEMVTRRRDPAMSKQAGELAEALREAEARQRQFHNLFDSETPTQSE